MSEYQLISVLAFFVFAYSLFASKLQRGIFNGAVVYVFAGVCLGPFGLDVMDLPIEDEGIMTLAELALAVCLFSDSANANFGVLKKTEGIPLRLLLIGLPLTVIIGTFFAWLIFPELSLIEVGLIGVMLAPTDAALGKAVVSNPIVPARVRESLNVESGLNDGICVPLVLLLIAVGDMSANTGEAVSFVVGLFSKVIGIGLLVGIVLGVSGAYLLRNSMQRRWVEGPWLQVPITALSLLCFGLAQWLEGSGFIASFVGGLVFGVLTREHKQELLDAAEATSEVLSMLTWFAFGTIVLGVLYAHTTWQSVVYAVLSLTLVRMLPVVVCLVGSGLRVDTKFFIGWFGPRGLASIVFLVMVTGEGFSGAQELSVVVVWTILLSVIAHGVTANPLSERFGARVDACQGEA